MKQAHDRPHSRLVCSGPALRQLDQLFPLGLRLRGPALELSNLDSSNTHNNTLQRTIGLRTS